MPLYYIFEKCNVSIIIKVGSCHYITFLKSVNLFIIINYCNYIAFLKRVNVLIIKVGSWNDQRGIEFSRNFTETYSEIVESLQNKTLVVTTIRVRFFWQFLLF